MWHVKPVLILVGIACQRCRATPFWFDRLPSGVVGRMELEGGSMTDSNASHAMRDTMSGRSVLSDFRTLFLDFAKAMFVLTNNKFVDAGSEKVLVQEYQFSGGDYSLSSPKLRSARTIYSLA